MNQSTSIKVEMNLKQGEAYQRPSKVGYVLVLM